MASFVHTTSQLLSAGPTMKSSLLHRLHIAMLSLSTLWAVMCLAAPAVRDSVMFVAIAVGPLVSYCIAAWLIGQLRRT